MTLTHTELLDTLQRLPDPWKYHGDIIVQPIIKPLTPIAPVSSGHITTTVESMLFEKTIDGKHWILREITSGGQKISFK